MLTRRAARFDTALTMCSAIAQLRKAIGQRALDVLRARFESKFENVTIEELKSDGSAHISSKADYIQVTNYSLASEWHQLCAKMLPSGVVVTMKSSVA